MYMYALSDAYDAMPCDGESLCSATLPRLSLPANCLEFVKRTTPADHSRLIRVLAGHESADPRELSSEVFTAARITDPAVPGKRSISRAVSLPSRHFRTRAPPEPFGTVSCSHLPSIGHHAACCSGQVGWASVALAARRSSRRSLCSLRCNPSLKLSLPAAASPVRMDHVRHLTLLPRYLRFSGVV